jgi:GNAT superfamily N-acetyltransferase
MSSPPTIRFARLEDIPTILTFIKAAAAEQAPDAVVEATEASLSSTLYLSDTKTTTPCFAYPLLIDSPDNTPAGLAIYLYTFSTWMARPGVCLEELYVLPEYRRIGYAKLLIRAMAMEAHKAGCSKMEWVCLEGNEKALRFYKSLGAHRMNDWVVLKMGRDGIRELMEGESISTNDAAVASAVVQTGL